MQSPTLSQTLIERLGSTLLVQQNTLDTLKRKMIKEMMKTLSPRLPTRAERS